ncbi:hypothetical protein AB1N83_013158 [Pleurotus pulmonarius]
MERQRAWLLVEKSYLAYLVGLLRCRDEIRRRAIKIRPIDFEAKFKEHGLTCHAEAGELEAIPDEKLASKKLPKSKICPYSKA